MKDTFHQGMSYIIHFVDLHPFLRRPQVLSTFTIHQILIKSNLSVKNVACFFKQSLNNSTILVHIPNGSIYLHMLSLSFFIVISLNVFLSIYCCKLFVIRDFLLTSSSDICSISCVLPFADVKCIGTVLFYICRNKVKK